MEKELDRTFRPQTLDECLGQIEIRHNLAVYVASAKARQEPIEHMLFCGPAGLGKTTLAGALAAEMGGHLVVVNAASIKKMMELERAIVQCEPGDILFIDEIHALKRPMQELLYTVMEDSKIELSSGVLPLRFSVIGATTHQGKLPKPMRDRFGDVLELQPYTLGELTSIVQRAAAKMDCEMTPQGAMEIAARSQGTPRIALRIARRTRDFALATKTLVATHQFVQQVCRQIGIDSAGLDPIARRVLRLLAEKGRAVGLQAVAAQLGEALETIEMIESFMLSRGLIERESSGRVITPNGLKHLQTCGL
jgi:Holliday junction DNA helicase RuvB